jgi:hypothetical protein
MVGNLVKSHQQAWDNSGLNAALIINPPLFGRVVETGATARAEVLTVAASYLHKAHPQMIPCDLTTALAHPTVTSAILASRGSSISDGFR